MPIEKRRSVMANPAIPRDVVLFALSSSRNSVAPYFQPIVRKDDDRHHCYEVLGRMVLNGTVLFPDQFLPHLVKTDAMVTFDSEILVAAIHQVDEWYRRTGTRVHIHVNADARTLTSRGYIPLVREMIYAHDIPADTLTVEVLETSGRWWENDAILNALHKLRLTGIRLAIDDFPKHPDPEDLLTWMHQSAIDFDVLKIDGSIVRRACADDEAAKAEIRRYCAFAVEHGINTVAECVEKTEHIALIHDLGVDHIQGFVYGKPAPASEAYHLSRIQRAPMHTRRARTGHATA
jgi:EAL domain-containing protein (putative c-di-GMP-specific phosphodiesterase class I)